MYNHDFHHDFHHERAFRARRLAAWVCTAFALLLIIGVFFYALQMDLIPGLAGKHINVPGLPTNLGRGNSLCPDHSTGDTIIYIDSGGEKRSFIVHVPPSYGQKALPLVITYHGYDNTATRMDTYTDMGAEADQKNFIVVFPQGALDNANPPKPSWNAGIGNAGPTGLADDVQFTSDLLGYMKHNYCIDAQRVYTTGYSIGGSMAYRVACALSSQIAAFATVEGAFYHIPGGCQTTRPIPFLEIHSLVDPLAPYNGLGAQLSVQTLLNLWFGIDRCNTNSSKTIFQKADVTGIEWSDCADGSVVEHYKITDGGHTWPGSATPQPDLGYTTQTINANDVIWNFVSQFKS